MTLQAFCAEEFVHPFSKNDPEEGNGGAYKLPRLGTLLDVHDELLLALLELRALAVEFALRFCQRALMLAQTLRWRYGATEEGFLTI